MFLKLRNKWNRTSASGILWKIFQNDERLMEELARHESHPADLAEDVVEQCWKVSPEWYDGSVSERPSAAALAAMSAAYAIWRAHSDVELRGNIYAAVLRSLAVLMVSIDQAISEGRLRVNATDVALLNSVVLLVNAIDITGPPTNPIEIHQRVLSSLEKDPSSVTR